ncbi:MAG: LemA family protein [Bacteroidales bacterium]|nr:LemA family protein [Bacteroidales bacterium]
MKKTWIIIIAILAVILIWGVSTYNKFVNAQENMTNAWGQVENVYQRRADLIPNLVAVVKDYTEFEQGTLIAVTEARAKATATTITADEMTEAQLQGFENAQDELTNSLNRLTVSVENYPDLKANEQFLTLQAQLKGCENRILVERQRFNEMVQDYNRRVRQFPGSIIASLFGFEKRPYFEASENAEQAPRI